jgi:hypothetical protein
MAGGKKIQRQRDVLGSVHGWDCLVGGYCARMVVDHLSVEVGIEVGACGWGCVLTTG